MNKLRVALQPTLFKFGGSWKKKKTAHAMNHEFQLVRKILVSFKQWIFHLSPQLSRYAGVSPQNSQEHRFPQYSAPWPHKPLWFSGPGIPFANQHTLHFHYIAFK